MVSDNMKKGIPSIPNVMALLVCLSNCGSGTTIDTRSIATDPITIAKGQASFAKNCSNCHKFRQEASSPSLDGLTTTVPVDWIKNFIKDPKTVVESGDERAQRLIVKFNELMPSFSQLSDEEINALIAFLHTQKAADKQGPGKLSNPGQTRRKSL
jgi:mono/diheme cytochrome c family protein